MDKVQIALAGLGARGYNVDACIEAMEAGKYVGCKVGGAWIGRKR